VYKNAITIEAVSNLLVASYESNSLTNASIITNTSLEPILNTAVESINITESFRSIDEYEQLYTNIVNDCFNELPQ